MTVHTDSFAVLAAFRANSERSNLAITDQTMPRLTGEALSREFGQLRPDLPVILCPGHSRLSDAEQANTSGDQWLPPEALGVWAARTCRA